MKKILIAILMTLTLFQTTWAQESENNNTEQDTKTDQKETSRKKEKEEELASNRNNTFLLILFLSQLPVWLALYQQRPEQRKGRGKESETASK